MKFEKEFMEEHPETIGEKDSEFDKSNYIDWLEQRLEESSPLEGIIIGLIGELKSEANKLEKEEWYNENGDRITGYRDAINDLGVAARKLGYTKEAL